MCKIYIRLITPAYISYIISLAFLISYLSMWKTGSGLLTKLKDDIPGHPQ